MLTLCLKISDLVLIGASFMKNITENPNLSGAASSVVEAKVLWIFSRVNKHLRDSSAIVRLRLELMENRRFRKDCNVVVHVGNGSIKTGLLVLLSSTLFNHSSFLKFLSFGSITSDKFSK